MKEDSSSVVRRVNWRRGFFRVWCLLAALWVIFAVAVSWSSIASPYVAPPGIAISADGTLESVARYSAREQQLRSEIDAKHVTSVPIKVGDSLVEFFRPQLEVNVDGKKIAIDPTYQTLAPDQQQKTVAEIAAAIVKASNDVDAASKLEEFEATLTAALHATAPIDMAGVNAMASTLVTSAESEARQRGLQQALWLSILPPLVLLLLGAAVGWTLSGFRRATSRTS